MRRAFAGFIVVAGLLFPSLAAAEPIKLKFSFFTSDRSSIYQKQIKPFVDAVNEEGKGLIEIEMYFSGAISKVQMQQPQLVADGVADMAIIVPGQLPEQFPDSAVMELPGVYADSREANLVFSRLAARKVLGGFDDFVVLGAFVSAGESIHSRKPIASLADLNGQTIRTNNRMEAAVLEKLGAVPVLLAINQTTEAISQGKIDGATVPPSMLFEFGIGRVTSNHYMIHLGGAPTAIVMNRDKFTSLPPPARAILLKYAGDWYANRAADGMRLVDEDVIKQLLANPQRKVVMPSQEDVATIQKTFAAVVEGWAASRRHNRELLGMAKAELAKLRGGTTGKE